MEFNTFPNVIRDDTTNKRHPSVRRQVRRRDVFFRVDTIPCPLSLKRTPADRYHCVILRDGTILCSPNILLPGGRRTSRGFRFYPWTCLFLTNKVKIRLPRWKKLKSKKGCAGKKTRSHFPGGSESKGTTGTASRIRNFKEDPKKEEEPVKKEESNRIPRLERL